MATSPGLLTTHGVRQLYHNTGEDSAIKLQVLGIFRYLADPALKERLGQPFADACNVFDVLLSDGRHKMKAVLAPKCHRLVWTRKLMARCIVRVIKSKVFVEDDQHAHRVVLLQDVAVLSLNDDGIQPNKVVARRYGAHQPTKLLEFVSATHPREVALLPLVGDRLYYMSLRSDDYTLDWACSFTDGEPDEDSPLDELDREWSNRSGANGSSNDQHDTITPVAWNSELNYCSDLFTPECSTLHTILEVLGQIKNNKRQDVRQNLPMLGAIRVKSRVKNLGDPNVANPFPFVFHAVVVDATGVFEVMFFGSMCAKYYLSLHEGDLIQFRGYAAATPQELQWTTTTSPFVWYPNNSAGQAYHVPKKYWNFLELAKVAPRLLDDTAFASQQAASWHLHQLRPSWLECNFVTTLNARNLGKKASSHLDAMYFDFVGVLSSVGRICRERRKDTSEVIESRWVKMIDSSSSHELVIKINSCSQPAVFRSLEAGNTLMLTKLQWVILPGRDMDTRIQYATTSTFSILRTNEAVLPFQSLKECALNVYFANSVNKNVVFVSRKLKGESKLAAPIEKKYRSFNRLPTDVQEFQSAFQLDVYSLRDLSLLPLKLEAYENRHVGFVGQVSAVRHADNPAGGGSSILLELIEAMRSDQTLTVVVSLNNLFQTQAVKEHILAATPPQSLPLIRLLPATLVDTMYAKAFKDGAVRSTRSKSPGLSLAYIEAYLLCLEREYFFSLQLCCDGIGHITWEVDALLARL